jgi:hypothetical protein
MKDTKKEHGINWHEAFVGALQLELFEYRDYLEFRDEVSLTTKPLRIEPQPRPLGRRFQCT